MNQSEPKGRFWITHYADGEVSAYALDEPRVFDPERDTRQFVSVEYVNTDRLRANSCDPSLSGCARVGIMAGSRWVCANHAVSIRGLTQQ